MYHDEIIKEVWQHRDAYTAQHHFSLKEMVADLQARQKQPNCNLIDRRVLSYKNIQPNDLSNHL